MAFSTTASVLCALLWCAVAGCGSRCKDVANARNALSSRSTATRSADVRVTLPFAHVNPVLANVLGNKALSVPVELTELAQLGGLAPLTATVIDVRVERGLPNAIRFATRIAVRDGERDVTELVAQIDVVPSLVRDAAGATLVVAFGPNDLVSLHPILSSDTKAQLGDMIERHIPERLRGKLPRIVLDEAASKLVQYLAGAAFDVLRRSLFVKLGELSAWRLRLPDLPIAHHTITSTDTAIVIDIVTDLPVRRGLGPARARAEPTVELSGSAAAELANWTIDRGHVPRWYDDGLVPKRDGEFTPRFDFISDDSHPLKIYLFQERGGCSYFRVGVRASIGMRGEKLDAVALDRELEAASTNPIIEVAAAVKFFLVGWTDQSKQIVARTHLEIAGHAFDAHVTSAELDRDELRFGFALTPLTERARDTMSHALPWRGRGSRVQRITRAAANAAGDAACVASLRGAASAAACAACRSGDRRRRIVW